MLAEATARRIGAVEQDDDVPILEACTRCDRLCEPNEIEDCPFCRKKFCLYCSQRVAARNFCSQTCGQNYFFSGEDDPDEGDEPSED